MYVLHEEKLRTIMRARGYRSFSALARALDVHRNTIQHYLNGASVFPDTLGRLFKLLQIDPGSIIVSQDTDSDDALLTVAPIFDRLHLEFPDLTFVLFGSRTRRTSHQHANWDLGIFRAHALTHEEYRRVYLRCEDLFDENPYLVDVINLHNADTSFLQSIAKDWQFIAGSWIDWARLQRLAREQTP